MMCYRNGYGYRCDDCMCDGKDIYRGALKGMNREEIADALRVLRTICEFVHEDENPEEEPVYMVAFRPGEPMKIITEDNANIYLPCFTEDDVIEQAPDLGLVMSFDRQLLLKIGEQRYLDGDALIYAVDDEGDVVSLGADDLYEIQRMLEKRTVYFEEDDEKMPVLSLN